MYYICKEKKINIQEILKFIPHRYPFLLVDRVLDYKKNIFIKTIKNITVNEPFFQGHFPKYFVFPGVLIIESIFQSSVILSLISNKIHKKKGGFYAVTGIKSVKFKKFVIPGDCMVIKLQIIKQSRNIIFFIGYVYVENKIVCSAEFSCMYILKL